MNRNTKLMLKTLFVFAVIIVLLTIVEYRAEGSTIRSIWDAIWYSLITLTTVGYGDKAPVTPVGRILGIMLALCSVGLLSTLVGIVLHLLRGQLLPRLRLRGCSNMKWYVFNCSGNEAQTLADELAKEEACMLVFPGEDEHGNRIDRNRVYFDGNGKHENESRDVQVSVDDSNINLIFEDESVAGIPYTLEEDSITLEGGYFTAEEIEEQIQGYWKLRTVSFGTHEFHIHFDKGSVESESASEALDGSNGEYYYYGPDEGQYTLNFGGFDTDMRHGSEWFYNIVDGEVVILHYDNICEHTDEGFPGEDGYSF